MINRRSVAGKEIIFALIENEGGVLAPHVRSQYGGGAYAHSSTLTVANGSSIGGNTATVSLPALSLSPLSSQLVHQMINRRSSLDRCERWTSR